MSLLGDREFVASRSPLPAVLTNAGAAPVATTQVVSFADGVAGTLQTIQLTHSCILDSTGGRVGTVGDTSFAFTTGTVLTTEVPWAFSGNPDMDSDTNRLATLANGEFMIDYENGVLLGKNATTTSSTTDTATYKVRAFLTAEAMLAFFEDQTNSVAAVAQKPLAVSTYTPDRDTSAAAEASSVIKASPGVLYGLIACNSSGSARYFQLFNSTSVPADTTVPQFSYYVAAGGTIDVFWPMGRYFSTGMCWAWSSTAATKTIGSTDGIADVLYK